MMPIRSLWLAGILWYKKGANHHAAALAYFLPFAIVPLLVFSITIVGLIVDKTLFTEMLRSWGAVISPEFRDLIAEALQNFEPAKSYSGIPFSASIFFILMIVITVNNFAQGLRYIWGADRHGWWYVLSVTVRSILFLFLLQLFFISIILLQVLTSVFPAQILAYAVYQIGVFLVVAFIIGSGYKILSYKAPSFASCFAGGVVVAFIFSFIQTVVNWWLKFTPVDNLYGAAGLLLGFLIWIYIITAILYYGAAYAKVFDENNHLSNVIE